MQNQVPDTTLLAGSSRGDIDKQRSRQLREATWPPTYLPQAEVIVLNQTNILVTENYQYNLNEATGTVGSIMHETSKKRQKVYAVSSNLKQTMWFSNSADTGCLAMNGNERQGNQQKYDQASAADSGTDEHDPSASDQRHSYSKQEMGWFEEGRYLKIWAEEDQEIHKKEFILLDTQNEGGKGVRIDELSSLPSGWFRTMIALDGPFHFSDKKPCLSLQYLGVDGGGPVNRFVRLDHTYNIPFGKYECQDLGLLGGESLETLREKYIVCLAKSWKVVDSVRRLLEEEVRPTPTSLSPTPSLKSQPKR
ncbi:hypothetical protein Q7P37_009556 [Cladosporium fusiforme]